MVHFDNWFNTTTTEAATPQSHIAKLQKDTKFYWSLVRLCVAVICFRLNSKYDVMKATLIFIFVIFEFMTSRLKSRTQANIAIGLIYVLKLWVASQIKENRLWLVPFSMFLQVNLYMHGVQTPLLFMSTVVSVFFISSVEASFYSTQFDPQSLETMLSSLFKGYKILSFNLMLGLIIINYLFVNSLKRYANIETKLQEAQIRLDESSFQYQQMLDTLHHTGIALTTSARKLEATKAELDSTSRELGELVRNDDVILASLSHELRNPLNSMLGNIELLLLEIKDPKFKQMLDISRICGETLLSLINNLLDVAKIKGARLELSPTPVKVLGLLSKFWKMGSIKIAQKGLQGALHISTSIPNQIFVDSHRITQILLNLLDNAVKFTKYGKVEVYVSWVKKDEDNDFSDKKLKLSTFGSCQALAAPVNLFSHKMKLSRQNQSEGILSNYHYQSEEKSIDEGPLINSLPNFKSSFITDLNRTSYKRFTIENTEIEEQFQTSLLNKMPKSVGAGYLQIEVVDTGCGIDSEIQSRLFHPFMQGDSTITRSYGGLGLGLFITKYLVEQMGGCISTESEKNKGAKFLIRIPCDAQEDFFSTSDELDRGYETSRSSTTERVMPMAAKALIVDDNPYNQTILQSFLKKMNIESETADNGLIAVEKVRQNPIDYYSFVFMDLQMPVMDGLTACKAIRNYEALKGVTKPLPLAIITGNASGHEKKECLNPAGEIRASAFFRKPFTFSECSAYVGQLFGGKCC